MEESLEGWSIIGPEPGGRDENKDWMARTSGAPRAQHWLWKPRTMTGTGNEFALNDVAEVVSSRLAAVLGLPAAECRYAVRDGELGAISLNVTPSGHDLHNGDVFLSAVNGYTRLIPAADKDGRLRGLSRIDEGYTLAAVAEVLDGLPGPPGFEHFTGLQVFAGYLVLDALVANTDRHPRNWAILVKRTDETTSLAPTFDHGSALGSGLTEENRRRKDVGAFCRRGRANPFSPSGQSLVHLARSAMQVAEAELWLDRVQALEDGVIADVVQSPSNRLSEVSSTFVKQVLMINRRRLCDVDVD